MSSSRTETFETTETTIEITMPQMGVSVAEGTVAEWLKRVGDEVAADETVCVITTDKVDVEIPAPASGVVTSIEVAQGETVAVGTVLGSIAPGPRVLSGKELPTSPPPAGEAPPLSEDAGTADSAPKEQRTNQPLAAGTGREAEDPGGFISEDPGGVISANANPVQPESGGRGGEIDRSRFYSPVVRRIADEYGVDLRAVEGHGVGGRVRKLDLAAFIDSGGSAAPDVPEPGERLLHSDSPYRPEPVAESGVVEKSGGGDDPLLGPTRREPLSAMRNAIGAHMLESIRTSAHCTTIVEADFSAVAARRAELKEPLRRRGVNPTYLAFVALATVEALQRFPVLNASIDGDEIVFHEEVNLGIAVAIEGGLVVPVIHQAQRLSLEGLAAAIGDLAGRARDGALTPDDVHGGTFTITNPGQFGAVLATPIINQPQVAILDLEAVVRRPVAVDDGAGGDAIAIRPIGYLCMSWDHRALDGAEAARFLADVRARVEGVGSGVEGGVEVSGS